MPNDRLVQISLNHAKATGLAMAEAHKLRAAGLNAAASIALGTLEGHLATLSDLNVEIDKIGREVPEEAPATGTGVASTVSAAGSDGKAGKTGA